MATGNGGRPSYRRRQARNVDRNHHQVHAGCSRVEAGRGGEGGRGGRARSCRGAAGVCEGREPAPNEVVVGRGRFVRSRSSHVS